MGLGYVDFWTFTHLLWGIIFSSILLPSKPFLSLFISNLVHFVGELFEYNVDKNGVERENLTNHVTDCIAFFVGTLIGYWYGSVYFLQKGTETLRWVLIVISVLAMIQEVGRELYPETWFMSPAFHEFRFFGVDINKKEWYKKIFGN